MCVSRPHTFISGRELAEDQRLSSRGPGASVHSSFTGDLSRQPSQHSYSHFTDDDINDHGGHDCVLTLRMLRAHAASLDVLLPPPFPRRITAPGHTAYKQQRCEQNPVPLTSRPCPGHPSFSCLLSSRPLELQSCQVARSLVLLERPHGLHSSGGLCPAHPTPIYSGCGPPCRAVPLNS